jgi:hypothetical protein
MIESPQDPQIIIEKEFEKDPNMSEKDTWKTLCTFLGSAKSKDLKGNEVPGPRYVAYDFKYDVKDGEGHRYSYMLLLAQWHLSLPCSRMKLALIGYCPENATSFVLLH